MRNGKWGSPFGFGVESFTIRTRTRTQHDTFVLTISKYTHTHIEYTKKKKAKWGRRSSNKKHEVCVTRHK